MTEPKAGRGKVNGGHAVETLLAGAHHLSLPWEVLVGMAHHDLTDLALQEFAAAAGRSG